MKKTLLVFAMIALAAIGVSAAPGDVAGKIYSTDILAYINGSPIPSYNIGGQTVVLVEDLCNNDTGIHYGFDSSYDNDTRTLTLTSTFTKGNAEVSVKRGVVGEVVGKIYETDIRVYFNSHEIKGYNIGGRTAICIEDMGAYTKEEHNAAFGYSKYLCNAEWHADTRELKLNTYLQDLNFFGNYPKRKLDITVRDNNIVCTFDQLNPYSGSVKFEFSDKFKEKQWLINPVYLNNSVVGQIVMLPGGMPALNLNDYKMHVQTMNLETVLSYGEAAEYVKKNFEIVSESQQSDATIYLAKKDGVHYLLFALANDGLVCDSKYDSSYSLVKLVTDDNDDVCLEFKSNSFSGVMPVSTAGYTFNEDYENYISGSIPENIRVSSRATTAMITLDGQTHYSGALYVDNTVYIDAAEMCELAGATCKMYGGKIHISTSKSNLAIEAVLDSEIAKIPDFIAVFESADAFVNGSSVSLPAKACYYNGVVYLPIEFFQQILK